MKGAASVSGAGAGAGHEGVQEVQVVQGIKGEGYMYLLRQGAPACPSSAWKEAAAWRPSGASCCRAGY